jgi:hypothetical protein
MNLTWVFANNYILDPVINNDQIKNIGSTWGSWRTWRTCGTDNVICHDKRKAQELVDQSFQNSCNFFVSRNVSQTLKNASRIKVYDGNFEQVLPNIEDIIAMHLVATSSDIVLLVGFDLAPPATSNDQIYHGLAIGTFKSYPETQWVLVDHSSEIAKPYQELSNLTCDIMKNVLQLQL